MSSSICAVWNTDTVCTARGLRIKLKLIHMEFLILTICETEPMKISIILRKYISLLKNYFVVFFLESPSNCSHILRRKSGETELSEYAEKPLLPCLDAKTLNVKSQWFTQKGATPHTARTVLQFLHRPFQESATSHRSPQSAKCPSCSPD